MQTTTNLGLKKPEPGDYALVSDINDNMDTLDTKVADVRDSKVTFTDADLDSGITSFPTFLTKIVSGMKLAKFLRDFKAGMAYVLHKGSLINNGTCNTAGEYALDAAYGKVLRDDIDSLNDSFIFSDVQKVRFFRETDKISLIFFRNSSSGYQLVMFGSGSNKCIMQFFTGYPDSPQYTTLWSIAK